MSSKHFFITGTDTGIGKTYATCALLRTLQKQNKTAIGIKPVISGAEIGAEDWEQSDTNLLLQNSSMTLPIHEVSPFIFKIPSTPHIATTKMNLPIVNVTKVVKACEPTFKQNVDYVLVESIGGWYVEINEKETSADLAKAFNIPVILVIGMRLGCMNHALLTVEAIQKSGLPLQGWIINHVDPHFTFIDEYIQTFHSRIQAPMLGFIPYQSNEVENLIL